MEAVTEYKCESADWDGMKLCGGGSVAVEAIEVEETEVETGADKEGV